MLHLDEHTERALQRASLPRLRHVPIDAAGQRLEGQRVSVIVPTLNEAENLPHVLPRIPTWVHEVIVVDGHSVDDTVAVARQWLPSVRIVMQEGKGKGAALRTAFGAVSGDIIVMLDADGSTAPEEIPIYVGALLAGADFVKGSRFLQGGGTSDMTLHRKLGNGAFVAMSRLLFGSKYTDLCYGYAAFWTRTVPALRLNGDGFEIETMMNLRALQAGYKVAEVPSFEADRIHGEGRLRTFPDGWRVLKTIIRERWRPNPAWAERLPGADRRLAAAARRRGPERRAGRDRRAEAAAARAAATILGRIEVATLATPPAARLPREHGANGHNGDQLDSSGHDGDGTHSNGADGHGSRVANAQEVARVVPR